METLRNTRIPKVTHADSTICRQGRGADGMPRWEHKIVQPHGKAFWQFCAKLNKHLLYTKQFQSQIIPVRNEIVWSQKKTTNFHSNSAKQQKLETVVESTTMKTESQTNMLTPRLNRSRVTARTS